MLTSLEAALTWIDDLDEPTRGDEDSEIEVGRGREARFVRARIGDVASPTAIPPASSFLDSVEDESVH